MKAMILGAGFGERLMPLTAELPKPAFPVANRPLLWYAMRLLLLWGVDSVIVNAHHLQDALAATAAECCPEGMRLAISREGEILGTGGGVRNVRAFFDAEPFIVVNGDILTDLDISRAVAFHLARGAVATLVLSEDSRRKELGEVMVDGGGRIRSLLGRPGGAGDLKPAFFTGIQIMSRAVFDFMPDRPRSCLVRDCYSRIVEEKGGLFGFFTDSYWSDIGTPRAYLAANIDLLRGACAPPFEFALESEEPGGVTLERPFLIGRGARVGNDVRIGPGAIIGAGAVLEDGCTIEESVVWPGGRVPVGRRLVGAVASRAAILKI